MADKIVELDGKRYSVPSDASMDEIDAYINSSGGGADFTKTAEPTAKAEPYDPSFGNVLSKEFFGGASDVATGVGNALSAPGPDKASQNALGVAQTGLGILRMLSSPIAAAGSQMGESTGEGAREIAEWMGMGPSVQAVIGTAVGAPVNVATQMIAAPALLSKALPVAMKAVQGGAKMLPGAQVALREIGKKAIARLPSILKPAKSADELFAELRTLENPSIALPEFQGAAKRILKGEEQLEEFGLSNTGLAKTAEKIKGALQPAPLLQSEIKAATARPIEPIVMGKSGYRGGQQLKLDDIELRSMAEALGPKTKPVPFDVIEKIRSRIGAKIGELRMAGGEELGAYKQLYKNLSSDLEQAAEKFTKLKEANKAANREFAIGELDDIFNATMGRAREGAEFTSSNFAQALNKIRDLRRNDELFAKGVGNVHLDRIERQLDELRKLKVLPPPQGQNVGSRNLLASGGTLGSIGTGIGYMMGGAGGATVGGSAGTAIGFAAPMLISRIMQGPRASKALTDLLKKTGEVSPEKFAALVALSKTEGIDDETGFRSIMKTVETDIKTKIAAANERYNLQRERLQAEVLLNR